MELALPYDILGPIAQPRPVELRGKSCQHGPQVLQVIDHHAQLQGGENGSRWMLCSVRNISRRSLSSSPAPYHVDGAAVVGVLRQHPDPLLQGVAVVHHNLAHILEAHRESRDGPRADYQSDNEHLGPCSLSGRRTSVSLTMSMKASSGSGQESCSHSWQMGWIHATRSTAEELCFMGTAPDCRGWSCEGS